MNDNQIINKIQEIRRRNNIKWMELLKIAFKYAPDRSRKIMKAITENDMKVSKLSGRLANASR